MGFHPVYLGFLLAFVAKMGAYLIWCLNFCFWRQNTKAPHWREGLGMNHKSVDSGGI